ncbi:MAG TPA: CHAT domain-containing protein [Leptolyngbyaceae cyanobacterium]
MALAFLAACLSASVSFAFPEKAEFSIPNHKESIPHSQLLIANSQQLLQQGRELFQSEQYSQAAEVWQQAVSALQASGDRLNQAQAYNLLSVAYQYLGKWSEAQQAISYSLSLLQSKENSSNHQNKLSILAQAFSTQGHLQLALGKSEDALISWEKAADIYQQIKDTEGLVGSQINQAQAMQYLGLYRRAKKTLEEVETYLQNQEKSTLKATGLHSLGNAMRAIGELEKSRQLLQQSLQIAEELRYPATIAAVQFSLGNTANALAKRAIELDDLETGKTETQNAINYYQKSASASKLPELQVQAQLNQLNLLVENQQFDTAEKLRSQIQLNQLPASRSAIYNRVNLAQTLMKLSLVDRASSKNGQFQINNDIAQILAKAIEQAKILKDAQSESYALGSLGRLYELNKQYKYAEKVTQKALILAQSINASDIVYKWQWQLGRLLKQMGENKKAIAAYTTAVETVKSLRSDLVAINSDNADVQFSFRESVEPVYRELVDLLLDTPPLIRETGGVREAGRDLNQDNLKQARLVIESLQLAELDNFFQEACLDAKPIQIDRVDTTAAVIYPIILPQKLAVILALPNEPLHYYATLKSENEIVTLLNEVQQDIGRIAGNNQLVLRSSQQIYDWIIRPAETEMKNAKVQTLVFVLDGLLRNIPMAALHDGQKYLIEKYSIALTPGLQLLPPKPLKTQEFKALAVGLSEARQGFNELPNVERELENIKIQVSTSEILLNQEFTDTNFQATLNAVPFPVVHIATHGQFSSSADKTFILTWNEEINVKELDNLLRRRGEQGENQPIELLVFSACETADGDSRAALGLAGVAVRAGARSTIATLWQVSDESTATLMTEFYRELAKLDVTKAEALRQAQLAVLKSDRYKLPYFWAPYVLVGNWR